MRLKKLHLSHLKTAGAQNFHKISAILNALDRQDMQVTGDVYCYNASMTQLSVILPSPFDEYDDAFDSLEPLGTYLKKFVREHLEDF